MDAWVTGWQTGAGIPFSPKLERAKEVPGVKVPRVTAPNQKVSSLKGRNRQSSTCESSNSGTQHFDFDTQLDGTVDSLSKLPFLPPLSLREHYSGAGR
jgi:hypothetical protein